MFLRSVHHYVVSLVILLTALPLGSAQADFFGEGDDDSGWTGEFAPEGYSPYQLKGQQSVQQLVVPMQPPLSMRVPVSPRPLLPPVVTPVVPPLTYPGYYSPLQFPSVTPYAPGLYTPDLGIYPGYLYPFNNNQYIAPLF